MFRRENVAAVFAEFLGTATLATVVFAMVGRTTFPFFADVAAGVTLALMVLAIGEVSGAHINPAVTLGMWTVRKISTARALVYIVAQMLGGLAVWGLLSYLINKPLPSIAAKSFDWRIFIAEAIGTFVFTFGIASAVYQGYEGARKAITIGASLMIGALVASIAANGLLNPAVALGVQSWDKMYVLAPIIGSVVGVNLYALLFAPTGSGVALLPSRSVSTRSTVKSTKVTKSSKAKARKPVVRKRSR